MGGRKEKETSSYWARKSSQKQKEAGLGIPTKIPKSHMTFLPSESKRVISYRAGHTQTDNPQLLLINPNCSYTKGLSSRVKFFGRYWQTQITA